jgi:hypothetical protein
LPSCSAMIWSFVIGHLSLVVGHLSLVQWRSPTKNDK